MSNLKEKLLHRILHLKINSRFFRPNTMHRLPQRQKTRNPSSCHYIKIYNYFNVLKDLKQVITTYISTTYTQEGIRFYFSSEQVQKFWLNYFRFNNIGYYTYQTAENKAHKSSPWGSSWDGIQGIKTRRISCYSCKTNNIQRKSTRE